MSKFVSRVESKMIVRFLLNTVEDETIACSSFGWLFCTHRLIEFLIDIDYWYFHQTLEKKLFLKTDHIDVWKR